MLHVSIPARLLMTCCLCFEPLNSQPVLFPLMNKKSWILSFTLSVARRMSWLPWTWCHMHLSVNHAHLKHSGRVFFFSPLFLFLIQTMARNRALEDLSMVLIFSSLFGLPMQITAYSTLHTFFKYFLPCQPDHILSAVINTLANRVGLFCFLSSRLTR